MRICHLMIQTPMYEKILSQSHVNFLLCHLFQFKTDRTCRKKGKKHRNANWDNVHDLDSSLMIKLWWKWLVFTVVMVTVWATPSNWSRPDHLYITCCCNTDGFHHSFIVNGLRCIINKTYIIPKYYFVILYGKAQLMFLII